MKKDSNTDESVKELLGDIYAPLLCRHMSIFAALMESKLDFESGFGIDHLIQLDDGRYDGADYPLPMFDVKGICEIYINIGSIDFYTNIPEPLPSSEIEQFHILEAIELDQANYISLFRMSEDEDAAKIIAFTEKLKKVGANL